MTIDQSLFFGALIFWGLSLSWLLTTAVCAILQPYIRRPAAALVVPISIVVPTRGARPGGGAVEELVAMRALPALAYPVFEIILSVDRGQPGDGLALQTAYPSARVEVATIQSGGNPKVDALASGAEQARHDCLVFFDDDILVEGDCLQRLLAPLQAGAGLVSAAAIGTDPGNFWGEVDIAFMNGQFARLHLAGDVLGLNGALGKAIMVRRADLERVGGWRRTGGDCCEDAGLTRNIRAVGLEVALSDQPVRQPIGLQEFTGVWRRHRRWLSCRRRYLPAVFAGEAAFCTPLTSVAGGIVASELAHPAALGMLATALIWCLADCLLAGIKGWPVRWLSPWAWLVREILFLPLWLSALWANTDVWPTGAVSTTKAPV